MDIDDVDTRLIQSTPSFGARLASASKKKPQPEPSDDESSSSSSSESSAPQKRAGKEREREDDESSGKKIASTSKHSKHAPITQSSKKPVTRSRRAVEVPRKNVRDPRFDPIPDSVAQPVKSHYAHHYEFLTDIQRKELSRLRKDKKVATKRIQSVPKDGREEAEQRLGDLHLTAQRLESALDRKRKAKLDEEARKEAAKRWKRPKQKPEKGKGK